MLNVGDYALILIALAFAVAIGAWFFSKTRLEPIGIVRANEWTDEKVRQAVIKAVKGVNVASMPVEEAEAHLEELARHAIAREYAEIHPGLQIQVTDHWPDAKALITGNTVVIRPWVGHRIAGESGIREVIVEVNRQPTLKLDARRPIKEAWSDITSPPKRTEAVAPRLKVASAAPAPSTTPPPRAAPRKATLKR
jgi:hypothetical protein